MKTLWRAGMAALSLALSATVAVAADWPTKPVKVVVPSGPGSSPDIFARLLTAALQQRTHQAFVVENKGGASGSLGIDAVLKSPADGHTLGLAYPAPLTTNPLMMKSLPYDAKKDVQLVTNAVLQPTVLAVGNHLGVSDFKGLAELLRKSPGKYNSASTGAASLGRLLAEALAHGLGTKVTNVVYNGAAPTVVALMRGEVDFAFLPAAGVMSFVDSNKVKLVALAGSQRSTLLPDVPTLKELGLPQVDGSNWLGIIAPAGVAPELAARIRQEMLATLQSSELKKALAANYMEVVGSTPAEFAATIDEDIRRWKPLIEKLAISMD